ncbi:DUF2961 domain-containing protein [Faecalicatena contorta]|uniref:glycoside hydrolase family 172 protein n=1 Tax=Faecalicatena contorta TaxID=39482 RepID=UPI00129DA393|nr:glycoside hydrolase family 172 protein [Faecalicatena contorta]MRM88604.1 DUF2961 domain-containing protein [Faecalicatena contorta]
MFGEEMFTFPKGVVSRWASFENTDGEKGAGGKARNGRKGSPWFALGSGESRVLAHAENTSGIIRRMWITISDQTPETLRGLKLEMFWDMNEKAAVSVPLGDFFCVGLGKTAVFKNALFSNPEGRSFSTYIPMPFKTGMKIVITNEAKITIRHFYYDIDYTLGDALGEDILYFHSYFNRQNLTCQKKDFEILPCVKGRGRFLGTNMGVRCNTKLYSDTWWGEGEFKAYIDGDDKYPTICGTGVEDYIGTAWGQDYFYDLYCGCPVYDKSYMELCCYRLHIPDPIYFNTDFRATIQQIGGVDRDDYFHHAQLLYKNQAADNRIISVDGEEVDFADIPMLDGRPLLFEREDDWSCCTYFYLDSPVNDLPELMDVSKRSEDLVPRPGNMGIYPQEMPLFN